MPTYADPEGGRLIPAEDLRAWTAALVEHYGTPADVAADVAEVLVAADRRGIASHGTARLPQYLALIEAGTMDPAARPERVRSKAAIGLFEAYNGWGHHASRVAMDAAVGGAAELGSYTAVVRGSNHFGIAGWYALRAADAGLIGISMTNSSPLVAATRGIEPVLGTNPLAVAAPAGRRGHFCLDMATSTITRGKVEVAARRHEELEPGWAIDVEGRPTTDPTAAFEGALLPLGGLEVTGGHKGYGLTLLVDILTGVLGGSTAAPMIAPLFSTEGGEADLGQVFMAIDPDAIDEPGAFAARLETEFDLLTNSRAAPDAPDRILIPGEPEVAAERRSDERGVVMDVEHHADLVAIGTNVSLPFPNTTAIGDRA